MPRTESLRRRLAGAAPLLLDGGTGTGLSARLTELRPGGNLTRLNLDNPKAVVGLHEDHLRAGANVLRTNSFCASSQELGADDAPYTAEQVSRAAAELARAAARRLDAAALCLGVIGPGAGMSEGVQPAGTDPGRIRGLLAGGVDGILAETLPGVRAARLIASAVREVTPSTPLLLSFSLTPEGRLPEGGSIEELARVAGELEADLVGLNCAFGPEPMDPPLTALRAAWRGPLGAWPNAGLPTLVNREWEWPVSPDAMASWCARAVRAHALQIVGGCCGTTAGHVAAIAHALRSSGGAPRP